MTARICIVTNAPVSQNPRVVKEADALSAQGYDVVVVFAQHAEWTLDYDRRILDQAKWRGISIEFWPGGFLPRLRGAATRAQTLLFGMLARVCAFPPIAELAYSRLFLAQLLTAMSSRADLYIGHNPPSLPVVAWAAKLTGAKYGFDFEDFHDGEKKHGQPIEISERLLPVLQRRYLPGISYATAASWAIAEAVHATYGGSKPITVLNVFPWNDRARLPNKKHRSGVLSLYWFSQIVSLDRGLQDSVTALGLTRSPVCLHIRGAVTPEVKSELMAIARRGGAEDKIFFHDLVPPQDVLLSCADYDIGLCLEAPVSINRDICITNKIFIYMLAGLAVVASRTRGQTDIFAATPEIGFLYQSGDVKELSGILERLASDHELLDHMRAGALDAAQRRWNWEMESQTLVNEITKALEHSNDAGHG